MNMARNARTCSHRFIDGDTCGARPLRGEEYCHYHLRYQRSSNPNDADYELPLLEDKDAVQVVVRDIMRGILKGDIDSSKGSLLLYAAQIASNNLARWQRVKEKEEDHQPEESQEREDPEEPKLPVMVKILTKTLADLKVIGGPHDGRPANDVLQETMRKVESTTEKK
jgi:hypothetical protein